MDNKKIVSVAVLAVLALAFAGYGYADYTASTYNADNSIEVNYITVEPDDWAAIAAAEEIKIDTYTYNDDILYTFDDMPVPDANEDDGYVQIGNDYKLTINNDGNIEFTKYTIDVSILGEVNQGQDDGFKFYLVLNYGETDEVSKELASSMSFDVDADTTEVTFGIYLYVDNIKTIQFPTTTTWEDITGTTSVPPVGPVLSGPVATNADAGNPADDPNTTSATETGAVFIFKVTGVEA